MANEECYIGSIELWPSDHLPMGWLKCQGQLLPASSYQLLFAVIGFTYGGDLKTNFALPDFSGRFPTSAGRSRYGTMLNLGDKVGSNQITMTAAQIPAHSHKLAMMPSDSFVLQVNNSAGNVSVPYDNYLGIDTASKPQIYSSTTDGSTLADPNAHIELEAEVRSTGGYTPIDLMPPYLALNFIIAAKGQFPPRPDE